MSGNVVCRYEKNAYGVPGDDATLMDDGRYWPSGTRKCIIVRGGHGSDGSAVGPLQGVTGFFEVTRACIDAGYTVYCADLGGSNSWWNAASMSAMEAAITHLVSTFGISRVALFGGSMGGGVCLQSIKNPAVRAVVNGIATISSPTDLDYVNGTPGYTPAYTYDHTKTPTFGAWAGTTVGADCRATDAYNCSQANWAATTAGHRIYDEPETWRNLPFPVKMWHGDNDQVVPYAMAEWWVEQVADPNVQLVTLPGAYHTPALPSQLGPQLSDYVNFFDSLTWS